MGLTMHLLYLVPTLEATFSSYEEITVSTHVPSFTYKFDFPPFTVLVIALLNDGTIMTVLRGSCPAFNVTGCLEFGRGFCYCLWDRCVPLTRVPSRVASLYESLYSNRTSFIKSAVRKVGFGFGGCWTIKLSRDSA